MSSNVIQENYSNVLDYIAKTLSLFKCHIEYSQKLTEDCNSLFQLGKLLHKDYQTLLESTNTPEISPEIDPIMTSFEQLMDNVPIQALYSLWPVQTVEINQNSIIQSIAEPITLTSPEPEITQPSFSNSSQNERLKVIFELKNPFIKLKWNK